MQRMQKYVVGSFFAVLCAFFFTSSPVYAAAPTVTFTAPLNRDSDVIPSQKILVTFSQLMDPRTISKEVFFLKNGSTVVPGTLTHPSVYHFTRNLTLGDYGDDVMALQRFLIEGGYLKIRLPSAEFGYQPTRYFGYQTRAALAKWQLEQRVFPAAGYFGPLSRARANAALSYIFTPDVPLDSHTTYTASVTTGAKDAVGAPLAKDFTWTFTTAGSPDIAPFGVTFTTPANEETEVSNIKKVIVTFNKPFDPLTLTRDTFTVAGPGGKPIVGSIANVGLTSVFTSVIPFEPLATYTATITTGAKDLEGAALEHNSTWSFMIGPAADKAAPTFRFLSILNVSARLATNASVSVVFNEPMDPLTINTNTFILSRGAVKILGTVGYVGRTATFTPLSPFTPNTAYTLTITTGAKDLAGNAVAVNSVLSFTTAAVQDAQAPIVSAVEPADRSFGVSSHAQFLATFSEHMDPLTVTTKTFIVKNGAEPVPGTVTYDAVNNIATFFLDGILESGTTYTASITSGAKDLAGNALASDFVWNFTIGNPLVPTTPAPTSLFSVPSRYPTIQAAVNAASDGDTIDVAAGTYDLGSTLNITKSVTIRGADRYSVLLDASGVSGYGIHVHADGVILSGFTLKGPAALVAVSYGIKVEGSNGLTINNVNVQGSGRSEIDLNGVMGATLTNIAVDGQGTPGTGLAMTDSRNITMNGITTNGNNWGGIAVYVKGSAYPGGSDNITIAGVNQFSETTKFYTEIDNNAYQITNIHLQPSDFTYYVSFPSATPTNVYYATQAEAVAAAATSPGARVHAIN